MTRTAAHIVMAETADGDDGFAQWIEDNKIKRQRLNLAPNRLRGFFKKFRYVVVSSAAKDALGIHGSTYNAKDFVEILVGKQRRS
jgi:hypothetical protein